MPLEHAPASASSTSREWFALIVRNRHDKSVMKHLAARDVEFFAPTYEAVHRWTRGTQRVILPVFPGCVFVHIPRERLSQVVTVPGVFHVVSFGQRPYAVPDADIEALRRAVQEGRRVDPTGYVAGRERQQIVAGPLAGIKVSVVKEEGVSKLVVSIDALEQAATIEMTDSDCAEK